MIIQFGRGDESAYGKWDDDSRVLISRPYFKVVLDNGWGVYVLNAFEYNFFPKFYATFKKSFCEFGFSFAGWIFEVMWNKSFEV